MLDSLFKQLVHDERPLGSRGNLCAMTPGLLGETDTIWSDRPFFLWQGKAEQVTLRSYETGKVLWQQTISSQEQSLPYSGAVLKPGQVYVWEVASASAAESQSTFAIMPAQERDRMTTELQNLEAQRQAERTVPAMIALERAQYFGERGLWSDALQTLYAVDSPPAELIQTRTDISNYLCGD